jgi:hypothetical protein
MRQFLKALVLLPMVAFRLVNILARKAPWPRLHAAQRVNEVLDATIGGLLKEDLLQARLATEAHRFNIPHVRSSGDDAVAVAEHSFCPLARSRRGHYM